MGCKIIVMLGLKDGDHEELHSYVGLKHGDEMRD